MDYDYWLRLGQRWPGRFVDRYLAAFRWYPASKSGAGFRVQFREELDVARQHAGGRYRWRIFCHWLTFVRIVSVYGVMRWLDGVGERDTDCESKDRGLEHIYGEG
jgi:hypothetical protein